MIWPFKKKASERKPSFFTPEQFVERNRIVRSPNGRYRWTHNADGTVTEHDFESNTQTLLYED